MTETKQEKHLCPRCQNKCDECGGPIDPFGYVPVPVYPRPIWIDPYYAPNYYDHLYRPWQTKFTSTGSFSTVSAADLMDRYSSAPNLMASN